MIVCKFLNGLIDLSLKVSDDSDFHCANRFIALFHLVGVIRTTTFRKLVLFPSSEKPGSRGGATDYISNYDK